MKYGAATKTGDFHPTPGTGGKPADGKAATADTLIGGGLTNTVGVLVPSSFGASKTKAASAPSSNGGLAWAGTSPKTSKTNAKTRMGIGLNLMGCGNG